MDTILRKTIERYLKFAKMGVYNDTLIKMSYEEDKSARTIRYIRKIVVKRKGF